MSTYPPPAFRPVAVPDSVSQFIGALQALDYGYTFALDRTFSRRGTRDTSMIHEPLGILEMFVGSLDQASGAVRVPEGELSLRVALEGAGEARAAIHQWLALQACSSWALCPVARDEWRDGRIPVPTKSEVRRMGEALVQGSMLIRNMLGGLDYPEGPADTWAAGDRFIPDIGRDVPGWDQVLPALSRFVTQVHGRVVGNECALMDRLRELPSSRCAELALSLEPGSLLATLHLFPGATQEERLLRLVREHPILLLRVRDGWHELFGSNDYHPILDVPDPGAPDTYASRHGIWPPPFGPDVFSRVAEELTAELPAGELEIVAGQLWAENRTFDPLPGMSGEDRSLTRGDVRRIRKLQKIVHELTVEGRGDLVAQFLADTRKGTRKNHPVLYPFLLPGTAQQARTARGRFSSRLTTPEAFALFGERELDVALHYLVDSGSEDYYSFATFPHAWLLRRGDPMPDGGRPTYGEETRQLARYFRRGTNERRLALLRLAANSGAVISFLEAAPLDPATDEPFIPTELMSRILASPELEADERAEVISLLPFCTDETVGRGGRERVVAGTGPSR